MADLTCEMYIETWPDGQVVPHLLFIRGDGSTRALWQAGWSDASIHSWMHGDPPFWQDVSLADVIQAAAAPRAQAAAWLQLSQL